MPPVLHHWLSPRTDGVGLAASPRRWLQPQSQGEGESDGDGRRGRGVEHLRNKKKWEGEPSFAQKKARTEIAGCRKLLRAEWDGGPLPSQRSWFWQAWASFTVRPCDYLPPSHDAGVRGPMLGWAGAQGHDFLNWASHVAARGRRCAAPSVRGPGCADLCCV